MSDRAITFDFHNTLATCPEWFELEVRRLPSAFLRRWSEQQERVIASELCIDADTRYRQLRTEIIDHGNELTAADCLESVFDGMQITVPRADIETGIETLMHGVLPDAAPVEGAVETVRAINRSGIRIGVVSSAVYHPFLEWTLESFGLSDDIQIIVTSASAGFYKSRPEIYWHAAELLGVMPERLVHVGDSLRFDVGGAARAGCGTVWLQRDGARGVADGPLPDLTVTTLTGAAPGILDVLGTRHQAVEPTRG